MNMITAYDQQSAELLSKFGVTLKVEFSRHGKHFADDKEKRAIYKCTLRKGRRSYVFDFGQSIAGTLIDEKPTEYDIMTCLQKYEVGTFEDFCSEFGYDEDSRTAERTYKAVVKEYDGVCRIFSDEELEILQEIN